MPTSQRSAILSHLQAGHCIDPMSALGKFGCFRLAARIAELRQAGHRIETRRITTTRTGKSIAVYRMVTR
jgi:hypothetical protein